MQRFSELNTDLYEIWARPLVQWALLRSERLFRFPSCKPSRAIGKELGVRYIALEEARRACAHLLFCSKNIERIGDHATNIAETVVYLVTGVPMSSERPRGRQETDIDVEAAGGDA